MFWFPTNPEIHGPQLRTPSAPTLTEASTVDRVFQDLWETRTLAAPTGRVFAPTEPNVTRMRTASNLLENRTTRASARLDGPGMGRFVDRTGTSTVGPTLTCPAKRRDAAWTIVSTLQTLVKRTATAMALATLATTTQITTESQTRPTTVPLSQIPTNSTPILTAKTCEETPATTAHICPTLTRRTRTKMDSETSATQTRTMTEFLKSGTTAH